MAAAKEPEHPVTAMAEAFKEAGVKDEPKETNAEIGRVLNQMKELSDKVAALEAENKNMRQWINEMLKPVEVGALEEREGPAIPDIHKMVQKLDIKGLGFLDPDEATLYQSLAVLTELVMEQTVERLHYRIEKHFHTTLSIDDGIKHQHEKREMRHARERIVGNGS